MTANDILSFWFEKTKPIQWWKNDSDFDALIKDRFETILKQATHNELYPWRYEPLSALAEIIILDQFSRNIFRGTAKAFLNDPLALALAQAAIEKGYDQSLTTTQRSFLYMPYMHSESKVIHEQAIKLFKKLGDKKTLDFEYQHQRIIDKFGRYPHRNSLLGRQSTPEELEFLTKPNSHF